MRIQIRDDHSDINEWRARLTRGASQPIGWLLGAESLKEAADVLANQLEASENALGAGQENLSLNEFSLRRVYMMLMGYALENLLKGMLVGRAPDEYVGGQKKLFSWGGKGHDLLWLARRAGVQLTEDEVVVCARLTDFATWAGRYWFAMELDGQERHDGFSPVFSMASSDRAVAERLYKAWSSRLETAAELGQ